MGVSILIASLITLFGIQRLDAGARNWTNPGFRLLILPGLCVFWPLLLRRLWLGQPPPTERNAHRAAARP